MPCDDTLSMILPQPRLKEMAREWIREDIPSFDVGSAVAGNAPGVCRIIAKSPLVFAGKEFAEAILNELNCTVEWIVKEGTHVKASETERVTLGFARGPTCYLLQAERTVLELLTRCSACASYSAKCMTALKCKQLGFTGKVSATRKTTPGSMRLVEKYGILAGGADPHRYSLSNMTMLKDNHITASGSIGNAVKLARELGGFSQKVEVEARNETEAWEACTAGADVVMLDNFTSVKSAETALKLKAKYPNILLEASGGITHKNIAEYANPGIDIISVGRLTHGPPPVDISMKLESSFIDE